MCQLYSFQLECCLTVHCGCMFCFAVSGFQIVLDCLLHDLSFCICLIQGDCLAVICVVFT